jgi:hypothetical protein
MASYKDILKLVREGKTPGKYGFEDALEAAQRAKQGIKK